MKSDRLTFGLVSNGRSGSYWPVQIQATCKQLTALLVSNGRSRWIFRQHLRIAEWSNVIQVFPDRKCPEIALEVVYDGETIWLYRNVGFVFIRRSIS